MVEPSLEVSASRKQQCNCSCLYDEEHDTDRKNDLQNNSHTKEGKDCSVKAALSEAETLQHEAKPGSKDGKNTGAKYAVDRLEEWAAVVIILQAYVSAVFGTAKCMQMPMRAIGNCRHFQGSLMATGWRLVYCAYHTSNLDVYSIAYRSFLSLSVNQMSLKILRLWAILLSIEAAVRASSSTNVLRDAKLASESRNVSASHSKYIRLCSLLTFVVAANTIVRWKKKT